MTLQEEMQALLHYINEKHPGPIIRQACETRIKFLSERIEKSQGTKTKHHRPCYNIATGKVYSSMVDAARDISVNKFTLIGDIYRGSYHYGIRPLIFS